MNEGLPRNCHISAAERLNNFVEFKMDIMLKKKEQRVGGYREVLVVCFEGPLSNEPQSYTS